MEERAEEKKKKGGKKNTPGQTGSHQLELGKFLKKTPKKPNKSQRHFARCRAKNAATEGPALGLMNGDAGLIFRPAEPPPPGRSRGYLLQEQRLSIPEYKHSNLAPWSCHFGPAAGKGVD